jgi:two-component system LytT family response regulator
MEGPVSSWSFPMTTKMNTLIADDEEHSLERLRDLLQDFEAIRIVDTANDGISAIEKIDLLKPDLVFLDIQMPGANGFQVLERILHQPMVIFVTAYDDYAIKAFEENALDYILKPSSKERIAAAVNRALERSQKIDRQLLEALKNSLVQRKHIKRFAVKQRDEIIIIPEEDVFYFQAESKYIFLYTFNRRYFVEMTLKELEKSLDPERFCRVHKSTVVSLDKIRHLKKWFRSQYIIQMSDEKESKLKMSRNYMSLLKQKLNF